MKYPNLELLVFKAREILRNDKELLNSLIKNEKVKPWNFDVNVFRQLWGSTNGMFDVTKDGVPNIGGAALTYCYTTVIYETENDIAFVFCDDEFAYMVQNPNDKFCDDWTDRNMTCVSVAKKRYDTVDKIGEV